MHGSSFIHISAMSQLIYSVKSVNHSDKPTKNCYQTLQVLLAFQLIVKSVKPQFNCLVHSQSAILREKAVKTLSATINCGQITRKFLKKFCMYTNTVISHEYAFVAVLLKFTGRRLCVCQVDKEKQESIADKV